MYALPRALHQLANTPSWQEKSSIRRGPHEYQWAGLHTQFKTDLGSLIRRIAADKPAGRVPSEHECRFCDITAEDCSARVNSDPSTHEGTTLEF